MKTALTLTALGLATAADATPIEVPLALTCTTTQACWISTGCEDDDLPFVIRVQANPSVLTVTWLDHVDTVTRVYDETMFPAGELYARGEGTLSDQLSIIPQNGIYRATWTPAMPRGQERTYKATCEEGAVS